MNSSLIFRFAFGIFAVIALLTQTRADDSAPAGSTSPSDRLYVTVETSNEVAFDRYRWSTETGADLVIPTLKAKAAPMAKAAGFIGEIVVLDENVPAPPDARVLRLTWSPAGHRHDMTIQIEYLFNSKAHPKFLGVVSNQNLRYSPEYEEFADKLMVPKFVPDRRDTIEAAKIAYSLYFGLERIVKLPASAR